MSDTAAAATGARLGRQLAIAGIVVAFVLVARRLRAAGVSYVVVKNTLAARAAEGTDLLRRLA